MTIWPEKQRKRPCALRPEVEGCRDCPARNLVLGMIDWELGDAPSAERWLRRAVQGDAATVDGPSAARGWAQLAEVHAVAGRFEDAVESAQRALSLASPDTPAERLAWLHLAIGDAALRGGPARLERLDQRLPASPSGVPPSELDLLVTRASIQYYSARTVQARSDLESSWPWPAEATSRSNSHAAITSWRPC